MIISNIMDTVTELQLETAIKDLTDEKYFGDGLLDRDEKHLSDMIRMQKELPPDFGIIVRDSYMAAYVMLANYRRSSNVAAISPEDFTPINFGDAIYWYQSKPT